MAKKMTKSLGMLLLSAWLILTGLQQIITLPIPEMGFIMALLAIAAGVLLILKR